MNKLFQTITSCDKGHAKTGDASDMSLNTSSGSRLLIRDLILDMIIGIHEHELKKKQSVCINVVMDVADYENWQSDDIIDVISYEMIVNKITELAASRHFNLVENFAEHISQICLSDNRCLGVTVRIEKPEAIEKTKSVGVEITRLKFPEQSV